MTRCGQSDSVETAHRGCKAKPAKAPLKRPLADTDRTSKIGDGQRSRKPLAHISVHAKHIAGCGVVFAMPSIGVVVRLRYQETG